MNEHIFGSLVLTGAWTLIHFVWQGLLAASVYFVWRQCVGQNSSRLRYLGAMTSLFSLPFIFIWTWRSLLLTPLSPTHISLPDTTTLWPVWATILMTLWGIGILFMSFRLTWGFWQLRTVVVQSTPVSEHIWRNSCDQLRRALNIHYPIAIRSSAWADVPMIIGILQPVILVPSGALTGLSPFCIKAILAHELMHARRHDYLVNLLQSAIEAIFFFHPLVWWLSHAARVEREVLCDEGAVQLINDRVGYARALVELASSRHAPLAPAMTDISLKLRIKRLISQPRTSAGRGLAGLIVAFLVSSSLIVYAMPSSSLASWFPPSIQQWSSEIISASQNHQIDPNLLAAMVLVESGGDPKATSPRGATGLMQVMPDTASYIASARKLPALTQNGLLDAQKNLDFGAWYLKEQLNHFKFPELAVAAYNAGPDRIGAYLNQQTPLPKRP